LLRHYTMAERRRLSDRENSHRLWLLAEGNFPSPKAMRVDRPVEVVERVARPISPEQVVVGYVAWRQTREDVLGSRIEDQPTDEFQRHQGEYDRAQRQGDLGKPRRSGSMGERHTAGSGAAMTRNR